MRKGTPLFWHCRLILTPTLAELGLLASCKAADVAGGLLGSLYARTPRFSSGKAHGFRLSP